METMLSVIETVARVLWFVVRKVTFAVVFTVIFVVVFVGAGLRSVLTDAAGGGRKTTLDW